MKAEEAISRSDEILRQQIFYSVAENSPDFIGICGMDFLPFYINPAALRIVGLDSLEQVRKTPVSEFFFPEDRDFIIKKFFPEVLRSGNGHVEIRFRHFKTGEAVWMLYSVWVVSDGGKPIGLATVSRSVNDHRLTEQALRASEERMRRLTESFSDYAIFTSDLKGQVLSWNTGAEKIFGYTEEEMIGKSAEVLFTPEDNLNDVPESEMRTARNDGRASDERWHVRKDHSRFYASGVMAPLFDEGVLVGSGKSARDVTEAKKIEEELHRYRNELETLVEERTTALEETNASLRQEMYVRTAAEKERIALLRRIVTTQEDERRRIARDMHDQLGQQMTALRLQIASLVGNKTVGPRLSKEIAALQETAGRLDSEISFLAWELRPAALDDLGFVAAVKEYVAEWARHYDISVEFHAGSLERRRLDPQIETNLYRITQEALNNTHKHSGAKHVNVVIEKREGDIVLIIEDDGAGFSPEEKKSKAESASGLGLISMRERAAIAGGNVEIETSPGVGTTIFVRVPARFRETD
jgi:PAS domain S-box-containing protein